MPYSSYSNYLEYKNCKRQTLPCNNNFDSYKKYNRSLNCTRAWWTTSIQDIIADGVPLNNIDIQQYVLSNQCKTCEPPSVAFDPSFNEITMFNPITKNYCTGVNKYCRH